MKKKLLRFIISLFNYSVQVFDHILYVYLLIVTILNRSQNKTKESKSNIDENNPFRCFSADAPNKPNCTLTAHYSKQTALVNPTGHHRLRA